jgi:Predicted integral membrane protein (DUF2269)
MNLQTLYHLSLVIHIIGLTTMAGATLVDYVAFKQFWKQYSIDKEKGMTVLEALSKLPMLMGIGIILLILSGVAMMGITHGVFGEQIWFRIKFALVIIIIINGIVVGRRQGLKLRKLVADNSSGRNLHDELLRVKGNMRLFHLSQILLFIVVFTLSVFKYN